MAEDPEKRFQRIMDKLYHSPKPKRRPPSGTEEGSSRKLVKIDASTKRMTGAREVAPQPCRPWDRGDLMRRLATFKAMTWFGKPKVVNPVNCARRGWVNVGVDTISCEACGSRLFFSNPSSWSFELVEKAAEVFSLKLDSGHKLLCPWIDNLCDDSLASFPPTPAATLVEACRERWRALLQLSALPIISQSAIDYMNCEQLNNLLEHSSTITCTIDNSVKIIDSSSISVDVAPDAKTSHLYFEAEKVIGLCGWEVRLLPYIVGKDLPVQNRQSSGEKNDSLITLTDNLTKVGGEKEKDPFGISHCDLASAVLDCKLCGACVGLWAFDSMPRPLESFTLVDSPEADIRNDHIMDQSSTHSEHSTMSSSGIAGRQSNMSIAGGAPPTKQHSFRPRITLPIISRHLRAQLGLNYEVTNSMGSGTSAAYKCSSLDSQLTNLSPKSINITGLNPVSSLEASMMEKQGEETGITGGDVCALTEANKNDATGQSFSNIEGIVPSEKNIEGIVGTSSEGIVEDYHGNAFVNEIECNDKFESSMDIINQDSSEIVVSCAAENQNAICAERNTAEKPSQSFDAEAAANLETCRDDLLTQLLDISCQKDTSNVGSTSLNNHDHVNILSCSGIEIASTDDAVPDKGHLYQKSLDANTGNHKECQCEFTAQGENKLAAPSQDTGGKLISDVRRSTKTFDPIMHHKLFCPWIATTECQGPPGWKLTLLALSQQKGSPASAKEAKTRQCDKSKDPIISIRKLFETPPSNRSKHK